MLSSISFSGTAVFSGRNFRLKSGVLGICNRWNLETKIHIRMESTDANRKTGGGSNSLKPDSKLEQIIHENAADGWEKSWELGVTPWDLGRPTPILMHLHQTGVLPKGRALIPGCGSGYDVAAISCCERFVVGLDISENCIKRANELSDHNGGPPYKVSVTDYEDVLSPLGFQAEYIDDNDLAIGARKGREKLGRWKRSKSRALL